MPKDINQKKVSSKGKPFLIKSFLAGILGFVFESKKRKFICLVEFLVLLGSYLCFFEVFLMKIAFEGILKSFDVEKSKIIVAKSLKCSKGS